MNILNNIINDEGNINCFWLFIYVLIIGNDVIGF